MLLRQAWRDDDLDQLVLERLPLRQIDPVVLCVEALTDRCKAPDAPECNLNVN